MVKRIKKIIFPGANLDREKRKAVVIMLKALKKFECKFPKQYREAEKISKIVWDFFYQLGERDISKLINLRSGILLHQIGFLLFSERLKNKLKAGEQLTENETKIFRDYPKKSLEVLSEYIVDANPIILEIIEKSEEREDGKGRIGIQNNDIPFAVKIFKIAKCYVQNYEKCKNNENVTKILLNSNGELNTLYAYSFLGYISQNKQFVEDILNT